MGFINTTGEIVSLLSGNERARIINVLMTFRDRTLKAYLFPRWTRLPTNYTSHFKNPDKTIKPGSSEMAGLIVTVDREVYDYSTAEVVKEALNYVSTSRPDLQFVYDYLAGGIKDSPEQFNTGFDFLESAVDGLWQRGLEAGFVKEGCLKQVERKSYNGGLLEVQYNAGRNSIVSAERVEKRKTGQEDCPYCIQEEGREDYPWNNYILSANPYPYYDHHIVIVNKRHVYQFIDEKELAVMADFVVNAPRYTVVYNGPPGTSILGHMHFQAGIHPLPVEKAGIGTIAQDGALRVSELIDFPTRAFVVEKALK
jgi:hypothetical protein